MTKICFFLSTGRTGTKFLADYFDANFDGVMALHEPRPSYPLRMLSHAYMAGKISRRVALAVLRWSRTGFLSSLSADYYVEANPYLYGLVDLLHELVPHPTIVHLVRDPREFVRSAINHGSSSGKKWLASRLIPFWYPDLRGVLGAHAQATEVGVFAAEWVLANRVLGKAESAPADYHVFRFEDIFDPSFSGLRQLCGALGLEYPGVDTALAPSTRVNPSRQNRIGSWEDWSESQCRELHQVCTPLMQEYGYGLEDEWLRRTG